MGLELWYQKMIPTLLPFMILSGIMIRMELTEGFISFLYPVIRPIYKISRNACYCLLMGFLCGFPMGAKTVSDLYSRQMINKREAEFLQAFCYNIGPVYFVSFVLPLLKRQLLLPYLFGMYGVPLLYGLILRYTVYRDLPGRTLLSKRNVGSSQELRIWDAQTSKSFLLLYVVDESITSSVQSNLSLGGYMILFNLLNLLPHILLGKQPYILAPLLEISGGLNMLQQNSPLYALLLLPFGGLSCIAQTNSCIKNTDLSFADYTLHKILLTVLTAVYYLGWFLVSPGTFLL